MTSEQMIIDRLDRIERMIAQIANAPVQRFTADPAPYKGKSYALRCAEADERERRAVAKKARRTA